MKCMVCRTDYTVEAAERVLAGVKRESALRGFGGVVVSQILGPKHLVVLSGVTPVPVYRCGTCRMWEMNVCVGWASTETFVSRDDPMIEFINTSPFTLEKVGFAKFVYSNKYGEIRDPVHLGDIERAIGQRSRIHPYRKEAVGILLEVKMGDTTLESLIEACFEFPFEDTHKLGVAHYMEDTGLTTKYPLQSKALEDPTRLNVLI